MRLMWLVVALLWHATMPQGEYVIVRTGAKDYHRPACAVIRDGKDVVVMTKGEAEAKSLTPHPQCDPQDPRNVTGAAKPAPPVFVFVDGGSYYHREKCEKLGPKARRVSLDEAARKQWPCRVCKPPIRPRKPK